MDDRIIICRKDECIVTAVFRGKDCFRLSVCRDDDVLRVGSIYAGRITAVVENMSACFADIGTGSNVYVPLKKLEQAFTEPGHKDGKVHQGDTVLLQIDRLPSKQKPASATGEISLVGNSVVLLSGRKGISFSKMIDLPGYRDSVREAFAGRIGDGYGIMLRTNAPHFETDKITNEFELLKAEYEELLRRFQFAVPGTCLKEGLPEYMSMFRDEHLNDLTEIVTDDENVYGKLTGFCRDFLPGLNGRIRKYDSDKVSLYHVYDLTKQFHDALSRTVPLKTGGSLVFDRTEAMTVVDVNSSRASESRKKNALHEINVEAAKELARQITLRSLSGMILCDFISTGRENYNDLIERMKEFTTEDRSVSVIDVTPLGIMEITRAKVEAPLWEAVKKSGFTP
ncbi:MAG: ribonuclease E/G [Lachnospiraceae bacterium]|nr:ribonuclease E/G [Lachnospiraceae bacterium]